MGSPKSYARMGKAEALVARWLSGAVSAIATQVPNAKYRCSLAEWKVRRIFGLHKKKTIFFYFKVDSNNSHIQKDND